MTTTHSGHGVWRIAVRGAVTPVTAAILERHRVTVVETTTLLETDQARPDACASTIVGLQACGLHVLEIHWQGLGSRVDG